MIKKKKCKRWNQPRKRSNKAVYSTCCPGYRNCLAAPAEHPVPQQRLLSTDGEDAARAYQRLYPRAKHCPKGLETHCRGRRMNPPSSIQTITKQNLRGRAKAAGASKSKPCRQTLSASLRVKARRADIYLKQLPRASRLRASNAGRFRYNLPANDITRALLRAQGCCSRCCCRGILERGLGSDAGGEMVLGMLCGCGM